MLFELRDISSADMVRELMARGAIRAYGMTEFVPGIVRQRYTSDKRPAFDAVIRARMIHDMAKTLAAQGVISFEMTYPRREGREGSFEPTDVQHKATFLTLDPTYDLEDR